jgi:hypothetical protein
LKIHPDRRLFAAWLNSGVTFSRSPNPLSPKDFILRKKLLFQDFIARDKTKMLALSRTYESISEVVERANEWIASEDIDVFHVETLLLPGVLASSGDISTNVEVNAGSVSFSHWHQVVRVWYT